MTVPRPSRLSSAALLPVLLAVLLDACDVHVSFGASDEVSGSGVEATEMRRLESFDEVRFEGEGRVEIQVGAEPSVELSGDDNLLALIETEVDGDALVIRSSEPIDPEVELVLRVRAPRLTALRCSGAGSLDVVGVDEDDLSVDLSGAAAVGLEGRVDRLELELRGVGSVDAEKLVAREAIVRLSGVGQAHVNATDRLDARISGVGRLTYRGDPVVERHVSGLGLLQRRD